MTTWFAIEWGIRLTLGAVLAGYGWLQLRKRRDEGYQGRHRAGAQPSTSAWHSSLARARERLLAEESPGYRLAQAIAWLKANAKPVMEAPTQVLPVVDLEETQALFLPDEDDTPRDLTHYQLSGGDANYLRLKDAMLEAELELIRAEIVPQPIKLRPPFQIEDIYDEAWQLVSAEATR